jgi:DNA polymerase III delta prime subunit
LANFLANRLAKVNLATGDFYMMIFLEEAAESWDLDRLLMHLGVARAEAMPGRQPELTDLEIDRLCGLLLNYSPTEIAQRQHVTNGTVVVSLSKSIYRYVEILLGRDRNSLENWRDVSNWLTEAGYRRTQVAINWAQMPDVAQLHGRQTELETLQGWALGHSFPCRVIAIHGPPGIGKTSLAIELAKRIRPQFEGVIWQSLRPKPSLKSVLGHWLAELPGPANQAHTATEEAEWHEQINQLMTYLREYRCLVVMDNLEAILSSGSPFGEYELGYENYRELFVRMCKGSHQSCILVTSRESTWETRGYNETNAPTRSLKLEGLNPEAAALVLKEQKLELESPEELGKAHRQRLIEQYRGNPHLLKMVASTIHEVFGGSISNFLRQRTTLFGEAIYLIEQQILRLSDGERAILQQLAKQEAHVPIEKLTSPHKLGSINALHRRSLIERSTAGYTLRPDVMEYVRRELY